MNTLILVVVANLIGFFIPARHAPWMWMTVRIATFVLAAAFGATLIAYLAYPGYIDHIEPTLADLGMMFRVGAAIYPPFTAATLHGLLYGPGLTELQALAQLLPVPVIAASKLPGVVPAAAVTLWFLLSTRSDIARAHVLFFFMFADAALWNRAEPLLGLAAFAAMVAASRVRAVTLGALVVGALAGFCASLKLHGFLYAVPAVMLLLSRTGRVWLPLAVSTVAGLAVLTLSVAPQQVDVRQYVEYLRLAGKHGIVPFMVFNNVCYLVALTAPAIYCCWRNKHWPLPLPALCVIAAAELVVALIGAKDGAGTHHLLPFIFTTAFLLDRSLASTATPPAESTRGWSLMFLLGALAVTFGLFKFDRNLARTWQDAGAARSELQRMTAQYPGLTVGLSDRARYAATFMRPIAAQNGTPQPEFAAFMDTQYSGLGDQALVAQMQSCAIKHWAVPAQGEPFSLPNFYSREPLLSAAFRDTFAARYVLAEKGSQYHVYRCQPG